MFRFHLSEEFQVEARAANEEHCAQVNWHQGRIAFCADAAIALATSTYPHAMSYTKTLKHAVLVIASRDKTSTLHLTTTLNARDFQSEKS